MIVFILLRTGDGVFAFDFYMGPKKTRKRNQQAGGNQAPMNHEAKANRNTALEKKQKKRSTVIKREKPP